MRGHNWTLRLESGRLFLACPVCLSESPGLTLGLAPPLLLKGSNDRIARADDRVVRVAAGYRITIERDDP